MVSTSESTATLHNLLHLYIKLVKKKHHILCDVGKHILSSSPFYFLPWFFFLCVIVLNNSVKGQIITL